MKLNTLGWTVVIIAIFVMLISFCILVTGCGSGENPVANTMTESGEYSSRTVSVETDGETTVVTVNEGARADSRKQQVAADDDDEPEGK